MMTTNMAGELSEDTARRISELKGEPEWLTEARAEAARQLGDLPMPGMSYGLHVMSQLNIKLEELKPVQDVTVHEKTTSDGITIEDLSAAAAKHEELLRPILTRKPTNRLQALHSAFWNNGIFVYAADGSSGKITLEFGQKQTEITNIVVIAGKNAEAEIVEHMAGGEGKAYRVEAVEISAMEGSKVRFASVQRLGREVSAIISQNSHAEANARVEWAQAGLGGKSTKQETISQLSGEGASTEIAAAFYGDETQQIDLNIRAVHNSRNTASNITARGALAGSAKAIVQSFTKIMQNAANSEGRQKSNVLLLSGNAKASPIPKLEIDNYDVKASHEASVGQLDSEKLFYMMSRGLDGRSAVKLVVGGFFEPVMKLIPEPEVFRQLIDEKMESLQ